MKQNLRPTAFHRRKHDFKENAITLELAETKRKAGYQLKTAKTPEQRRYAEGYYNGYSDVHNSEKPFDRYELASMIIRQFAAGYAAGKRAAQKERRKLLQQKTMGSNGNTVLTNFDTPPKRPF